MGDFMKMAAEVVGVKAEEIGGDSYPFSAALQ